MPNVMSALPNVGGALCSTPRILADAQYWSTVLCRAAINDRGKYELSMLELNREFYECQQELSSS